MNSAASPPATCLPGYMHAFVRSIEQISLNNKGSKHQEGKDLCTVQDS